MLGFAGVTVLRVLGSLLSTFLAATRSLLRPLPSSLSRDREAAHGEQSRNLLFDPENGRELTPRSQVGLRLRLYRQREALQSWRRHPIRCFDEERKRSAHRRLAADRRRPVVVVDERHSGRQ